MSQQAEPQRGPLPGPAATYPDHRRELAELVGAPAGPPGLSPYPVNTPMIGHWVEAMGDENPVYVSDEAARSAGFPGLISPPAMLQAWIMQGLRATLARDEARAAGQAPSDSATDVMMDLLDDEGMTSVVATNCDQTYGRPLAVGDRLAYRSVIESISDVKETGLGTGRFVTTRTDFLVVQDRGPERGGGPLVRGETGPGGDAGVAPDVSALVESGELVATMRFRILKYRLAVASASAPAALRPRPAITQDNAFWFEGAKRHQLLIQRCTGCGTLRHPPLPACSVCRSFEWDTLVASGRGEVYSFVVVHHPEVPGFDYPLAIGLIELDEGTRLVAGIDGVAPADIVVGMRVVARFVDFDAELTLPVFQPAPPDAAAGAATETAAGAATETSADTFVDSLPSDRAAST